MTLLELLAPYFFQNLFSPKEKTPEEELNPSVVSVQQPELEPRKVIASMSFPKTSGDFLIFPLDSILEQIGTMGTPEEQEYLRLMVYLENFIENHSQVRTSNTGSYRGIAQFGRVTWEDVRYDHPALPQWEIGVRDVNSSLTAALRLYRRNRRIFSRHFPGREFSKEIAYLYHQQGPSGAKQYLMTGELMFPGQSTKSKVVMSEGRLALTGRSRANYAAPDWVA